MVRYFLYNVLLLIAFPFIVLVLFAKPRCRRGFLQRLGYVPPNLRNLDSPVLWVHAVSLGEVTAVIPLVKGLHQRYPNWSIIISTVTETGREAVEERLAGVAHHCYCPLDFPWAVNAYLRWVHPVALLIVETELWPNLLKSVSRLKIPAILVNGRLSTGSFTRYRYIRGFMGQVLSTLTLCLMQSERDAQRIVELGAKPGKVHNSGNMKFDHVNDESAAETPTLSRSMIGLDDSEQLFVAGSTHSEEEEQLLRSYKCVTEKFPSLVLLIAPRHIERTQQIEEKVLKYGFPCTRKSRMQSHHHTRDRARGPRVILLDTRGELAFVYSLGWIAFVGGTLIPIGGHNLLEPARWGVPVFFGPFTDHCSEVAHLLREAGGGIEVQNEEELSEKILHAYHDASWTKRVGEVAQEVLLKHSGVVERNLDHISAVVGSFTAEAMETSTSRSSVI